MIAERIIEGRRCRLCGNSRYSYSIPLWIADTGDFAAYADNAGGVYCPCRIFCDYNGPYIIERKNGGILEQKYLEPLVLESFCPSPAYDEVKCIRREQMINHKDGDWMNCDYRNLEISPYHYRHTSSDRSILFKAGAFLEVFSNGTLRVDGVEIPVLDWAYFSQYDFLNDHYSVVDPYIIINGQDIRMEEIMEEAGFIQGDDAGLKEPAILHIDGNYLNYASGNLLWVRKRDPRYISYLQHKKESRRAREVMLNRDISSPW